jgi:DNA-binding MarR family transcriptional regulator
MTELVIFSFYGSTKNIWLSPHLLTRSLLAQKVLLSIRKKGKNPSQIGSEIGTEESYVIDELSWLSKNALVKKTNGNQWLANIIVLDKEEKKPLVDLAKELSQNEALKIKKELPQLKAAFKKCSFQSQGFSWHQMNYIFIAALLVDIGVNYSLHQKGMVPLPLQRSDGGRWYFWGLEGGADSKRQFGVNSNYDKNGGTAHIWSRLVKKPTTSPLNNSEKSIMLALANQPLKVSEIAKILHLEPKIVEQQIKKLSDYNYFIEIEDKIKLNFPIFTPRDLKIVITEITRISNLIVDDIIKPKETVFRQLFEKMGFAKLNREYGTYLCMLYHMIMDHTLDQLVENKILPEMPKEAPATWGFWGWIGELQSLQI